LYSKSTQIDLTKQTIKDRYKIDINYNIHVNSLKDRDKIDVKT